MPERYKSILKESSHRARLERQKGFAEIRQDIVLRIAEGDETLPSVFGMYQGHEPQLQGGVRIDWGTPQTPGTVIMPDGDLRRARISFLNPHVNNHRMDDIDFFDAAAKFDRLIHRSTQEKQQLQDGRDSHH